MNDNLSDSSLSDGVPVYSYLSENHSYVHTTQK